MPNLLRPHAPPGSVPEPEPACPRYPAPPRHPGVHFLVLKNCTPAAHPSSHHRRARRRGLRRWRPSSWRRRRSQSAGGPAPTPPRAPEPPRPRVPAARPVHPAGWPGARVAFAVWRGQRLPGRGLSGPHRYGPHPGAPGPWGRLCLDSAESRFESTPPGRRGRTRRDRTRNGSEICSIHGHEEEESAEWRGGYSFGLGFDNGGVTALYMSLRHRGARYHARQGTRPHHASTAIPL